jgi:hypothetical protein
MGMANVLNEEKKQQVLALGRLGWSLRRIQQATRIRRETASAYLKAAGIAVRPPGGWGRRAAKPANEVITDSGTAKPAIPVIPDPPNPNPNPENLSTKRKAKATSKPANENEVITGFGVELSGSERKSPKCVSSTSFCEPYREAIELGLSRGRNAKAIWQDLVSEYSFASSYQSVQRFVRKLRGAQVHEAGVVIVTAPGQEAQVDYGTGPMVRDPETRKYRRTRLFVTTLGCSRKSVRLKRSRGASTRKHHGCRATPPARRPAAEARGTHRKARDYTSMILLRLCLSINATTAKRRSRNGTTKWSLDLAGLITHFAPDAESRSLRS